MFKTISRAPNDEFTFSIFSELLSGLTYDFEAYYIWSNPPEQLESFISNTKFTKPNVVIGIKDLLDLWQDYDFWQDSAQHGVQLLDRMANLNPDKNFVIFTSLENIDLELWTAVNLQFIPWGGDLVNQSTQYQTIVPVFDKNFESPRTLISLNRNRRAHRLILLSYLFGKGYDQIGQLTYLGQQIDVQKFDNLLDCLSWQFDERHNQAREYMITGYSKFYNNTNLLVDDYVIYDQGENNNLSNFERRLRPKYQNSFVEIVTESSFTAPSFMLTEKTLHSVYGCNLPIILSGVGAVAHLRDLGFDMFDDIIDHSYDYIPNPFDRIIHAIDDNQRLLTDTDYAKQVWLDRQDRFKTNIDVAKRIYQWYQARTQSRFNSIVWS
jgi:hypothetical protein